jgi:ADP-heptose:LPS heptosyltransferase
MLAEYWEKQGMQVLFGGGPSEREKLNDIATRFPVAAGQADFVTSVGLTTLSSIVVGGDTGLMHAALAAGKRTVMVVGPTDYMLIGPYRHPEWTVRPHKGNLIGDISVEQVLEATTTALNQLKIHYQ